MSEEIKTNFLPCEHCKERISLLYCVFPNRQGFPYLQVCKRCVGNLHYCVEDLRSMCDDEYKWTGEIVDGASNVLWAEKSGQLFNPENDTRKF